MAIEWASNLRDPIPAGPDDGQPSRAHTPAAVLGTAVPRETRPTRKHVGTPFSCVDSARLGREIPLCEGPGHDHDTILGVDSYLA